MISGQAVKGNGDTIIISATFVTAATSSSSPQKANFLTFGSMITKKLAVPLVNDKILQQAEHVYIATSSITDAGFDFIRSRVPTKCKIDIVTGLHEPTSPNVLKRIFRNYQGRITLNLFTRNVLHANVFVFDLPFRKSVAFVGSGTFSAEGIKDNEELFWKITDAKEIESIMSWFTSYFEFGTPLTESLILDYEPLYHRLRQRQIDSAREMRIITGYSSINWDAIRFRNQFFKKEDFQVFAPSQFLSEDGVKAADRQSVAVKLADLQQKTMAHPGSTDWYPIPGEVAPSDASDETGVFINFRRGKSAAVSIGTLSAGINCIHFVIRMTISPGVDLNDSRHRFNDLLSDEQKAKSLHSSITSLGPGYTVEVSGVRKAVEQLTQEGAFLEFMRSDYGMQFPVIIERVYPPSDAALSVDAIAATLGTEMKRLGGLLPVSQLAG